MNLVQTTKLNMTNKLTEQVAQNHKTCGKKRKIDDFKIEQGLIHPKNLGRLKITFRWEKYSSVKSVV